jgi:hypothetical protein
MKKNLSVLAAVALSFGLIFAIGSGMASAKGGNTHGGSGYGNGHKHNPVVLTGTPICNFHGRLVVSASGAVSITGNITPKHGKACTGPGGAKIKTGHFSVPAMSTPTTTTTTSSTTTSTIATCTRLGILPDLSGGTIAWSPRPKVAASVGVALTGGSVSTVTVGDKQYLEITYAGGSVASGSFAGASGVTLTVRSNAPASAITAKCASGGSFTITFHGTLTL